VPKQTTYDLLGSSERAILEILWRDGPCSQRQIRAHHPVAYMTLVTTMRRLLRKGFVMRKADRKPHIFTAVPRAVLLYAAIDRQLADLGATASDRAYIVEALRHG
jgi:predicted transcriptional regulator